MEIRRTLTDSLNIAYARQPDKTVVADGAKHYSYAHLYQQSHAIAAHLKRSGVERGDRVADRKSVV